MGSSLHGKGTFLWVLPCIWLIGVGRVPSPRNLQNRYFFGWSKEEIDILCNGFPPMSQYRKVIGSVLVALLMSRCHPNCLISTVSHLIKLGWVLFSGVNVTFFKCDFSWREIYWAQTSTSTPLPKLSHNCQSCVRVNNFQKRFRI